MWNEMVLTSMARLVSNQEIQDGWDLNWDGIGWPERNNIDNTAPFLFMHFSWTDDFIIDFP